MHKETKIGETNFNNQGLKMEIIEDLGYIKQSKRDVILYNTCRYVTREGYLLAKYSSKNRKKDIKTLLNMLLKDLIRIKSCKSK